MGTDIHMIVEVHDGGAWRLAVREGWGDRSYDVFAMLADVRNGYGFAGCVTGSGFVVAHEQRGLPADLSDEARRDSGEDAHEANRLYLGDHSFSWLTAGEVVDFFAVERTTQKRGVVSPLDYISFLIHGKPHSFSGDVMGDRVRYVSIDEMDQIARSPTTTQAAIDHKNTWIRASSREDRKEFHDHDKRMVKMADEILRWCEENEVADRVMDASLSYYTEVYWTATYHERAALFLEWFNATVRPLMDTHGRDSVRLVFGFDS